VTPDPDLTWRAVSTANWTMVEVHAAIVCACLTTLKPLLSRVFPRLLPSYESGEGVDGGPERRRPASPFEIDTVRSEKSTGDSSADTAPGAAAGDVEAQRDAAPAELKTATEVEEVSTRGKTPSP